MSDARAKELAKAIYKLFKDGDDADDALRACLIVATFVAKDSDVSEDALLEMIHQAFRVPLPPPVN